MDTGPARANTRLIRKICREFHEMPGLSLTVRQAARLWNVDVGTSEQALTLLSTRNFLRRTTDGQYVATRQTKPPSSRQHAPTFDH